jgi:hypothetical protein
MNAEAHYLSTLDDGFARGMKLPPRELLHSA